MSTLICVGNIMSNLDAPPLWHYWCNLMSVLVVVTFFNVQHNKASNFELVPIPSWLYHMTENIEKQWGTETCLHCLNSETQHIFFHARCKCEGAVQTFNMLIVLLHVLLIASSPSCNLQLWKINLMTFKNIPYILIMLTRGLHGFTSSQFLPCSSGSLFLYFSILSCYTRGLISKIR